MKVLAIMATGLLLTHAKRLCMTGVAFDIQSLLYNVLMFI